MGKWTAPRRLTGHWMMNAPGNDPESVQASANGAGNGEGSPLHTLLGQFDPIPLAEIEPNSFFSRFDTKFLIHEEKLLPLLGKLTGNFKIMVNRGYRLFPYDSLYLDTEDFLFFQHHNSRRANRIKVRWRTYRDSGKVFFEVKRKCKNNLTEKLRLEEVAIADPLEERHLALFRQHVPSLTPLSAKIRVRYERITLFGNSEPVKITLDQNLSFDNGRSNHSIRGLVVGEIKCARPRVPAGLQDVLRQLSIRPVSFSKYAIGIASMEAVKYNGLKPTSLLLKKILHEQQSA